MSKEDQDFSKVENKFKLSLLHMEKRFVDLESIVSELSEKSKGEDLTPISGLQQRIDDIEDLIMVEQAAIIELKKMLESAPKVEAPSVDLSELEKKIADLEQKSLTPAENADMQPVITEMNNLKQQVDEKIKELQTKPMTAPPIDVQFIATKYDSLKASLDDIINKKVATELKIEGIQKSIGIVENRLSSLSSEKLIEEIQNNKKDIFLALSRFDSVENVIRNMTADLQELQAKLGKFESFEKLTLLGREIESKIERFKLIEDELRRLSSRMEMLYTNMDKRLDAVSKTEKKIPEILDSVTNFKKELDKQRIEILDRVKKDEMKGLDKILENNASKMSEEMEKKYSKTSGEIESKYNNLLKKASDVDVVGRKELENIKNDLNGRIANLKSELQKNNEKLSKEVTGVAADLQNSYNFINSLQKEARNKLDAVQMKDFVKKSDLQFIYKLTKELEGKNAAVDKKVSQLKTDEILKLMEVLKKDVEDRLNALKEKEDSLVDQVIGHSEIGFDEMDYRIQTLVDKIIYLETRMSAIEKTLEDTRIPLIIE
ncbi:MAG: hypothetical protein HY361_05510 [Candidatus Aenigmarchaeota archaeon]|nr:hypothetical protein [Candidatus Aenigmarchaeota archaeon]